MLGLLPGLFLVLAWVGFSTRVGWRSGLLRACVVVGAIVTATTELLSTVRLLDQPALTALWCLACALAGIEVLRRRGAIRAPALDLTGLLLGVPFVIVGALTAITAMVGPPNTWDSMTYHMARVAHWAADASVENFPTNIVRQLFEPPWSEFAIVNLQILSGSDRLANLVQWTSMVAAVTGVSLVASQLGSTVRGQVLAAAVAVSLPMGILQSSSTQTDYVLALWLVCAVHLALAFRESPNAMGAAWVGASLGLAALTKGTAYVMAAPLVLLMAGWLLRKGGSGLIKPATVALIIALLLNAGFYLRNQSQFENPLGPADERAMLANARFSPTVLASNTIRDLAIELGTPSPDANQFLALQVGRLHRLLRISVNDSATTWSGQSFGIPLLSLDEDYAGNPLHLILSVVSLAMVAVMPSLRRRPLLIAYAIGLISAFLLFAFYLKWQPWHGRLELPLFVLSAPLLGAVFGALEIRGLASALAAILIIAGIPWMIGNESRPLVGFSIPWLQEQQPRLLAPGRTIFNTPRVDLYFAKRPDLEPEYVAGAERVRLMGCHQLGVWANVDDWEYPTWFLTGARIEQVLVGNSTSQDTAFSFRPCALMTINSQDRSPSLEVGTVRYNLVWASGWVGVYEPGDVSHRDYRKATRVSPQGSAHSGVYRSVRLL